MPITINGTTGISGVDGSTGTPALIGSDADTGFVFAAGQVSASLNGTAANVPLVQGTAQNSTSGTAIDFTGIPSWVKRVTVMFNGVSTNGTSNLLVQIGAGSVTSSGYTSAAVQMATGGNSVASSVAGYIVTGANAATTALSGHYFVTNVSGNVWVASATLAGTTSNNQSATGSVTLSGTLDRIRITTVNGTDTFDAGSINILYE